MLHVLFVYRTLYWVEASADNVTQYIKSCDAERCSSQATTELVTSWTGSYIIGLHVAIDCGT